MSTITRQPTDDERMGMTWYNGLTRHERFTVLEAADRVLGRSGKNERDASSPADAWLLWKSGRIRMDGRVMETLIPTSGQISVAA